MIKRVIKDMLTEWDNETYDYNRILVVIFSLLVIFISLYILFTKGEVVSYLTEWMLAILGGGGVGTALKGRFEKPSSRTNEEEQ